MRLLPEWRAQDAVLLSWPTAAMDWAPYLAEVHATYEAIIQTVLRYADLLLVTPPGASLREPFLEACRRAPHTLYRLADFDLDDTWIRDYGPLCLEGDGGEKAVVDFTFNGWGGKFAAGRDNDFTRRLFLAGLFFPGVTFLDRRDFVFEGGAIDVSGRGQGLTTLPVLAAPGRNGSSPAAQAMRLMRELGLTALSVLETEPLPGDDTDGHVDTVARFIGDEEILTCVPLDSDDAEKLRERHRIHTLPLPDPVMWEGEQKPATYANFLITNGAVVVPTYGDERHDREALETIRGLAGDREVVGVDCRVLVRQNGSLHCATMQIPEGFLDKSKLTKA